MLSARELAGDMMLLGLLAGHHLIQLFLREIFLLYVHLCVCVRACVH